MRTAVWHSWRRRFSKEEADATAAAEEEYEWWQNMLRRAGKQDHSLGIFSSGKLLSSVYDIKFTCDSAVELRSDPENQTRHDPIPCTLSPSPARPGQTHKLQIRADNFSQWQEIYHINISKTSNQIKVTYSALLLLLSFSLVKKNIYFAFFLRLKEWRHKCEKVMFSAWELTRMLHHAATQTIEGERDLHFVAENTVIILSYLKNNNKTGWGKESKLYSVTTYKPTSKSNWNGFGFFFRHIHALVCNKKSFNTIHSY